MWQPRKVSDAELAPAGADLRHSPDHGGTLPPGVRPRDNLLRALNALDKAGIRPDVFLLTGDLANTGDGACYDDLAAIMTADGPVITVITADPVVA